VISRPLAPTRADQRRFVNREIETKRALGAVTAAQNVVVLGEPGSGRSSLLNHLAWLLEEEHDVETVALGGEGVGDASQLLGVLVARVRRLDGGRARGAWVDDLRALAMPDGPFGEVVKPALLMELVDLLAESVTGRGRRVCMMVDGLAPRVAHAVFGSLRNELWTIDGASWVLAGDTADGPLYREPPADAFFPVTVELEPFSAVDARGLLAAHGEVPADDVLREVVQAGAGNPRRLLRAAADAGAGLVPAHARRREPVERAVALAGPLAGRLVEYLVDHGPVSASDTKMLRQLGVSRQRVSELMHELEAAGLLDSAEQRRPGQPGRPTRRFSVRG
jgi:energy-coupling factor transporter ATP-binding protein EcfA2